MKKNDMILVIVLAVIALGAFAAVRIYSEDHTKNAEAVVTIKGEEYGRYPLKEDITVKIAQEGGGYNLLVIKDGTADITDASCPDKICVRHAGIYRTGETLVCLPNQVVVEIVNGEAALVDTSTQ